mgnify:FL=1
MIRETLPLFSWPVSIAILKLNNKKILKHLEGIKWTANPGHPIEMGGKAKSMTGPNFKIDQDLPQLKEAVDKEMAAFMRDVLYCDVKIRMINSWATRTAPQGYAAVHHHSNSWLTAVYYPRGNPAFKIRLFSPNRPLWNPLTYKKWTIHNSLNWTLAAEDNMLIICDSLLDHEVLLNESNLVRYSIAFTFLPEGTIGKGDGQVTLKY